MLYGFFRCIQCFFINFPGFFCIVTFFPAFCCCDFIFHFIHQFFRCRKWYIWNLHSHFTGCCFFSIFGRYGDGCFSVCYCGHFSVSVYSCYFFITRFKYHIFICCIFRCYCCSKIYCLTFFCQFRCALIQCNSGYGYRFRSSIICQLCDEFCVCKICVIIAVATILIHVQSEDFDTFHRNIQFCHLRCSRNSFTCVNLFIIRINIEFYISILVCFTVNAHIRCKFLKAHTFDIVIEICGRMNTHTFLKGFFLASVIKCQCLSVYRFVFHDGTPSSCRIALVT